jgi:hypothetical protein
MSDWQVGDLAVCVDDSPARHGPAIRCLSAGIAYTVSRVRYWNGAGKPHGPALYLVGVSYHGSPRPNGEPRGWHSNRFRKIRPDEHEDCEPEFVELLNRIRRKVSA